MEMSKEVLMKKIEAAVDAAMSARIYGKLEIEFVGGAPMFIRESKIEKLASGTRNRDRHDDQG